MMTILMVSLIETGQQWSVWWQHGDSDEFGWKHDVNWLNGEFGWKHDISWLSGELGWKHGVSWLNTKFACFYIYIYKMSEKWLGAFCVLQSLTAKGVTCTRVYQKQEAAGGDSWEWRRHAHSDLGWGSAPGDVCVSSTPVQSESSFLSAQHLYSQSQAFCSCWQTITTVAI